MQSVLCEHWGTIEYGEAWERQESLLQQNLAVKSARFGKEQEEWDKSADTAHRLILCYHPHVYTLGKSGHIEHLLLNDDRLKQLDVSFYKTNRGGDITYHGPGQLVAYPLLDLEKMFTDLGKYMRYLEEVIIETIALYGLKGERSPGETGVWLDVGKPTARKICAMGVRCSRWMTMHGLALNVNTDLQYFGYIVPCGIVDKGVTSMQKELGVTVDMEELQQRFCHQFEAVFEVALQHQHQTI
jgi:lipoyl(octanoyl) transferase